MLVGYSNGFNLRLYATFEGLLVVFMLHVLRWIQSWQAYIADVHRTPIVLVDRGEVQAGLGRLLLIASSDHR